MGPKISIITVVYNGELHIRETIESVLSQGYENFEYIIVDGESNDSTMKIIEEYKSKIDKIVSEKDNGISHAFNKGLRHASGDIIGFLNSDDYYEPNTLTQIAQIYKKNNLKGSLQSFVLYGNTYSLNEDLKLIKNHSKFGWWLTLPFSHCSSFTSAHYFTEYGGFNETYSIAMDIDFFFKGYGKTTFINTNIFIASQRTGGVSDVNRIEGYRQYYKIARIHLGELKSLFGYLLKVVIFQIKKYG